MTVPIVSYKVISTSPLRVVNSVSSSVSPDGFPSTLLDWLIHSTTTAYPSCLKVVWDLDSFAQVVLSLLPASVAESLSTHPHRATWEGYRLYYAAGKVFSVGRSGGGESEFYDLSQYFPDDEEPATISALQEMAELLVRTIESLGVTDIRSLSSPIAIAKGSKLLEGLLDTVPAVFDAPASVLEAFEIALQCTPREWVSSYQIGAWL